MLCSENKTNKRQYIGVLQKVSKINGAIAGLTINTRYVTIFAYRNRLAQRSLPNPYMDGPNGSLKATSGQTVEAIARCTLF